VNINIYQLLNNWRCISW